MIILYCVFGGGIALLGILGIVGGVFAIERKRRGVALTGAIAGSITFYPCGIAAVILISLAKPEFSLSSPIGTEEKLPDIGPASGHSLKLVNSINILKT